MFKNCDTRYNITTFGHVKRCSVMECWKQIERNVQEFFRCFFQCFHSYAGIVPQLVVKTEPQTISHTTIWCKISRSRQQHKKELMNYATVSKDLFVRYSTICNFTINDYVVLGSLPPHKPVSLQGFMTNIRRLFSLCGLMSIANSWNVTTRRYIREDGTFNET